MADADLSLIHALQIRPRGSWREIASILGTSPDGAARRWERLRQDGLAWVTAYPGQRIQSRRLSAMVEVDCSLADIAGVCARLSALNEVASIEQIAGEHTLLLTVMVADLAALSRLLLDDLPVLDGIGSTYSHIVLHTHVEGTRWRLSALGPGQVDALSKLPEQNTPAAGTQSSAVLGPQYQPIADLLAEDGRMTAAAVAARLDRPAQTVRRQLARLVRSGVLSFRCEVAQPYAGQPVIMNWWCRSDVAELPDILASVRRLPQVRLCASVAGPTNLVINTWNESLEQAMVTHGRLQRELPTVEIVNSTVTLRSFKRLGWLLRPDGRATGERVPLIATLK